MTDDYAIRALGQSELNIERLQQRIKNDEDDVRWVMRAMRLHRRALDAEIDNRSMLETLVRLSEANADIAALAQWGDL
jgi:hypothetical protein